MSRDWAQLDSDLLHLIFQKLENFSNSIWFRSVCKEWRSAVGPNEHSSHLPWILYPMDGCDMTDYYIYSLSSNTTCQIKLPTNYIDHEVFNNVESIHGFLLLKQSISNRTRYLFNPITETKIYPPFTKDDSFCNILDMDLHPNSTSITTKSGVHLVFCERLCNVSKLQVGHWKSDSNEFTNFRIPIYSRTVAYYKSKLFVYSFLKSKTWIFDMNTGAEMGIAIPNALEYQCSRYLLVAMGDLLMLAMKLVDGRLYEFHFNVYRLEHTSNFDQCRWIELKEIGDRILFVKLYNISINAFCLSTSNVNGLKGNCIYYLYYYNVLRYNMEDGTTDHICHIPAPCAQWFMPSYN